MLAFINQSPTAYHAIASIREILSDYTELKEADEWHLIPGGKYYVTRNDSSIIAFRMPQTSYQGILMAAAHSDSPLFKLKPNCETVSESAYLRLNTEKYGGMLYTPWLDRPLSIAGRIVTQEARSDGMISLKTQLVDLKKPVAVIPNLAIHMNRQANENLTLNPQVDLLPLIGGADSKGMLMKAVAAAAETEPEAICGSDLFLYNAMEGQIAGIDEELVLSRSLDDLQSAWALVTSLKEADMHPSCISMCCIFDNEEVGSSTRQGADSTFLSDTLERIAECCGYATGKQKQILANSFLISADNAHAVHPAHPEKADPTNRPYLNGGIVLKFNGNQKYTTDASSEAVIRTLCKEAGVSLQAYVNRSDVPGGSTLGNISTRHVSVRTADIGLPMLAMHSPYETAGVKDTADLVKMMVQYYSKGIAE